jgi:DNA-binding MarR family transcriptional regulator
MYAEFTNQLAKLGVTSPEWTALSQCGTRELTPIELANYMQVDKAAVTRIIVQLEAKGLLSRKPHLTDGRSTILTLTKTGNRLLPKLIDVSTKTNRAFLKLLEPEDREALLKLVSQLGQRLPSKVFDLPPSGGSMKCRE